MGYTIRDYINDEINKDLRELDDEYEIKIRSYDYTNKQVLQVYKNGKIVDGANVEIGLDTKLSNVKKYLIEEIERWLTECVGCGKWFDNYEDDEVDLDLTDDEYYHSLECLEKHDNQLWDRYCKALGD